MIRSALYDAYAFLFSRNCFYKLNRGLLHASMRGLGILNYKNDVVSGEHHFLKEYLSSCEKPILVDVGANEGSYSSAVLKVKKDARVFAFEPHPETYTRLTSVLSGAENVTCINAACGSAPGKLALFDYEGSTGTQHASLHEGVIERVHNGRSAQRAVDVVTLDIFATNHNISVIDLLKIDTEGHELEVLKGAKHLLRRGGIKAIQFEFGEVNVVSRVFFRDFCDLLPNYKFHRMLRSGLIALDPYMPLWCELFGFQNIVALPMIRNPE